MIRAALERNYGTQYEFAVTSSVREFLHDLGDILAVCFAGPLHALVHERTAARAAAVIAATLLVVAAWRFRKMQAARSIAGARQRPRKGRQVGEALLAGLVLFFLSAMPEILRVPMTGAMATVSCLRRPPWEACSCSGSCRGPRRSSGPPASSDSLAALPLGLLMLSAFLAHCNLQHVAANAVIELNFFRRELADVDPAQRDACVSFVPSIMVSSSSSHCKKIFVSAP